VCLTVTKRERDANSQMILYRKQKMTEFTQELRNLGSGF